MLQDTFAEFSRTPAIRKALMNTGLRHVAEATPFGIEWGIGLRASDPDAADPTK